VAKTTIMGSADYSRKDNRIEVPITIAFEGETCQTVDWGLGGFRVDGYKGDLRAHSEFTVDGLGPGDGDVFGVRIDCEAIRVSDDQLAASFKELSSEVYDLLEALMMRRKKYFEKLKKR
jgi:hypothetical protein